MSGCLRLISAPFFLHSEVVEVLVVYLAPIEPTLTLRLVLWHAGFRIRRTP